MKSFTSLSVNKSQCYQQKLQDTDNRSAGNGNSVLWGVRTIHHRWFGRGSRRSWNTVNLLTIQRLGVVFTFWPPKNDKKDKFPEFSNILRIDFEIYFFFNRPDFSPAPPPLASRLLNSLNESADCKHTVGFWPKI